MKHGRSKFTAIDLFAGIGGMRLGFEQAGFKIVYSNDIDKHCCTTYRANFGEIDQRDVKEVSVDEIPQFDVLLAGFPCQPFSMIGKRNGLKDERGKLFFEIVRILAAKRPKAFVLENVRHLLTHNKRETFQRILQNLDWLGYKTFHQIIDSQDFGVPQHRERLYIIGFTNPNVNLKISSSGEKRILGDILESHAKEEFYLSEKYYKGLLAHKRRHQKRGSGFGCEILDPNGVSHTLVAGNMGRERNLIRDTPTAKNRWGVRKLTVRECARLQGFPDSFVFPVPTTASYEQLGNAVTVPVAKTLAVAILKILKQQNKFSSVVLSTNSVPHSSAGLLEKTLTT